MDWWVLTDGELGMASVEVSGPRSSTGWSSDDVRAALEAHLEATDRDIETEVSAPFETGASFPVQVESPTPVQATAATPLTTAASPSAAAGSAARDPEPGAGPTSDALASPSATPAPTLVSVAP